MLSSSSRCVRHVNKARRKEVVWNGILNAYKSLENISKLDKFTTLCGIFSKVSVGKCRKFFRGEGNHDFSG